MLGGLYGAKVLKVKGAGLGRRTAVVHDNGPRRFRLIVSACRRGPPSKTLKGGLNHWLCTVTFKCSYVYPFRRLFSSQFR